MPLVFFACTTIWTQSSSTPAQRGDAQAQSAEPQTAQPQTGQAPQTPLDSD
jgi:hypothetical protein